LAFDEFILKELAIEKYTVHDANTELIQVHIQSP